MRKTIHWFILFAGLAEVQGWSNLSLWTKSSLAVPRNGRQTKQDHSLTLSDQQQQERRSFLETLWTTCLVTTTATAILPSSSHATLTLDPKGISTVVLNSPQDRLGVELADISLVGQQSYPYVKTIRDPKGQAAQQGITSPGFIVLQGTTASGVVQRIQQGPYPVVLQLYNLAYESDTTSSTQTPLQALQQYTSTSSPRFLQESDGPPVSPKGAGLKVQTIQRPSSRLSCNQNTVVQRGSTVTIAYEARVASPGGPIYDSSPEMTLRMGQRGQQSTILVPGVESGLLGMCVEEVRTLDIPSALGYGRRGSEEYDVPGDVRLWWKVTLLGVDNSNR